MAKKETTVSKLVDNPNSSKKKHKSPSRQVIKQSTTLQRPSTNDYHAWQIYWQERKQPWRTEPEIDEERQRELETYRAIKPVIEKGIYPFKGMKLSRADVEWLLATHENGRGPIYWSDQSQRNRSGLDLRGADLNRVDLHGLPLSRMRGGLKLSFETKEFLVEAAVNLEGANLEGTHLERSIFCGAHLDGANFTNAYLQNSNLQSAHLEGGHFLFTHLEDADLSDAHLEGAFLNATYLKDAFLSDAHLEGVCLEDAHLEGAFLLGAYLEGADLLDAHLEGTELVKAHLEGKVMSAEVVNHLRHDLGIDDFPEVAQPANLSGVFFDSATKLREIVLGDNKYGFVSLADVSWGNINLAVIDWSKVNMLGDERNARKRVWEDGEIKNKEMVLHQYHSAVRANRQLAIALQAQGINEQAARFAYRAQRLQRIIFRKQRKLGPYFFSLFLDILAGYGYRPVRSVFIYLLVIFGFALAYHSFGHLPLLPDSLVFSLTSFHGRGFFPGLGNQIALHNPLVVLASLEAIVGLLVEISFIATFTQRFFGR